MLLDMGVCAVVSDGGPLLSIYLNALYICAHLHLLFVLGYIYRISLLSKY